MKHKTTLHFLAERNRRYTPGLILLTLLEVARAYLGVEFAMVTRQVIDCAQGGSAEKLTRAALLLAAVVAGIMVLYASAQYLRGWLRATLDREWKTRLSHKLLHGDYATVSAYHSGELVNRLTSDVEAVNGGVIALIPNVAALLTRLVSAVWMMATMEPTFTLLAVACGLVVIGATGFFRQRLKTLHKQMQEANGKANGFVQEIMEKLLAVQAMSVEAETEAREKKILDSRWKLQMRQQRFSIMGTTGMYLACYLLEGAALVWCALRLMQGEISFGTLTAVVQLTGQLEGPILNFSGYIPQYVAMLASAERLMELEEISGVSVQKRDVQTLFGADTCIEAEGLCFAYDDTTVFDSASFRLPLQGSAAITGNSGIGKSTLLKLLLGIYKPTSGRLLLRTGSEEIPLNAETRGLFAYVPQGNLLFSGTLRENLLLTAPDATEQDMETAAFVSCMDEYLPQLEHGFDTVLGESGAGLSEGQAQRVSIARAVLSGAPVLLLDEATSALDAVTEQRVLERLNALPGRVCIAITHRPAALALSDRQMVIADGKITVQTLRKEEKAWIR